MGPMRTWRATRWGNREWTRRNANAGLQKAAASVSEQPGGGWAEAMRAPWGETVHSLTLAATFPPRTKGKFRVSSCPYAVPKRVGDSRNFPGSGGMIPPSELRPAGELAPLSPCLRLVPRERMALDGAFRSSVNSSPRHPRKNPRPRCPKPDGDFQSFLDRWHDTVPDDVRSSVGAIAELLGFPIDNGTW